jgi:hypothetical protein
MTPEDTERIALALLRALGAAHEAGIVHRDIKPANVMLTTSGEVLLTDFGIAVHQTDTALTTTGALIGSVEYMAPERARGTDGLAASDLFSLGVTLYQAVEGLSPFRCGTPTGCLAAVLFEEAPPAEHAGRLDPLITALFDKDPERRPDIPEALALLRTSTAHRTARTAPATPAVPASRRLPETGSETETGSEPETETGSQAKAVPRPQASPRPTAAGRAAGPTAVDARREAATPKEMRKTIGLGLLVVLLVGVVMVTLTNNWPSTGDAAASTGDAADKKVCDKAFQDIATFQRTYPSYTGESTDDSAAQTAADRLSADLHAEQAKASDVGVSVALGNYAVVVNAKVGETSHSQMNGYLRSACKRASAALPRAK